MTGELDYINLTPQVVEIRFPAVPEMPSRTLKVLGVCLRLAPFTADVSRSPRGGG